MPSPVEIVKSPTECRNKVLSLRANGKKIGFVPTMGALHKGHLKLVEEAARQSDFVVVSIFVNPAQFDNAADFEKYPSSFESDLKLLESYGCDLIFAPAASEMYAHKTLVNISFPALQEEMEGRYRPGHFEGVALVVSKLFHLVPAHSAFFGQKDWQQVAVIRQLVKDLSFDIQVVDIPTIREADGLAMSSRNQRLTDAQKKKAAVFHECLLMAKAALLSGDSVERVKKAVENKVAGLDGVILEYFEVAHRETLKPVKRVEEGEPTSLFIAGYVGEVRLIDNIFLDWK